MIENVATRDHTERAFTAFGIDVVQEGATIAVAGGQRLQPGRLTVPGDISGLAFWAALAGGTPGSRIEVEGVGLNPSQDRRPGNLQTRGRRR